MNFIKTFMFITFLTFTLNGEKLTVVTNTWYPYFDPALKTRGYQQKYLALQ